MLRTLLIIMVLPAMAMSQLVDDDVMPFGGYGITPVRYNPLYTDSRLQIIHDSLGLNQFVAAGFLAAYVDTFFNNGIYAYPEGIYNDIGGEGWQIEPQQMYSASTYFVCQPEDDTYNIRFKSNQGSPQGDYWAWRGEGVMLGNLMFRQYCTNFWIYGEDYAKYYPYLQIKRDNTTLEDSVVIAVFEVENDSNDVIVFADTIRAHDLPPGQDTLMALRDDRTGQGNNDYYGLSDNCDWGHADLVEFRFETFDACSLYVDSFLVHCQFGDRLMAGEYDTDIKDSTGRDSYKDKIAGWFLKDSARPGNYQPNGYIDGLIEDTTSHWTYPVRGFPALCAHCGSYDAGGSGGYLANCYRDFVRLASPEILWAYLYPLEAFTAYTGYSETVGEAWLSGNLGARNTEGLNLSHSQRNVKSFKISFHPIKGFVYLLFRNTE